MVSLGREPALPGEPPPPAFLSVRKMSLRGSVQRRGKGAEDALPVERLAALVQAEDHVQILVGDGGHRPLPRLAGLLARVVLLSEELASSHQRKAGLRQQLAQKRTAFLRQLAHLRHGQNRASILPVGLARRAVLQHLQLLHRLHVRVESLHAQRPRRPAKRPLVASGRLHDQNGVLVAGFAGQAPVLLQRIYDVPTGVGGFALRQPIRSSRSQA